MPVLLKHTDMHQLLHTLTPAELTQISTSISTCLLFPPTLQQPPRQTLISGATTALIMPCTFPPTVSIKTVSLPPDAPPKATLTLHDSASGCLTGILSADDLTAFRTALASVLYLKKRVDAGAPCETAVIFGTGKQAYWAVQLLATWVAPGAKITIVGRGTAEVVAGKISTAITCTYVSSSDSAAIEAALRSADAVFGCTPATSPLFPKEWLEVERAGRELYISLIGSYKPHMKEIDPAILNLPGVKTVVDSREACLREAGELIEAGLAEGDVKELGVVLGEEVMRGVVVFKCVGLAVMDLVAGRELVKIAGEKGAGTEIEGFE